MSATPTVQTLNAATVAEQTAALLRQLRRVDRIERWTIGTAAKAQLCARRRTIVQSLNGLLSPERVELVAMGPDATRYRDRAGYDWTTDDRP